MSEQLKKLIESNDFLLNILNNMSAAVFVVDKNVRVQNINKAFTKLFHKTEEEVYNELCGNAIGCVFPVKEKTDCGKTYFCNNCELRKNLVKCLTEKGEAQKTVIEREFLIGDEFILKFFYVITDYIEYNDIGFVLVMIYDITDLEAHRRKLEELNDLKNQFLGMAAHDLRNPIAQIMGASELVLEYSDKFKQEDKERLLNMIHASSNFMLKLVNNLLDISKIESGKLELEKTIQNYVDFVEECLMFNRLSAKQKNISIESDFGDNIINLTFDKTQINQVINNLIGNSIKFSPEGAKIIVKVEKQSNRIITKVIDEGPGIPKEELSKLFKEFQQTSVKPTSGEKGTGLGLAISKKIVEKHGGQIGVESEVRKGSTFYFILPI